jgi:hypothetical protein
VKIFAEPAPGLALETFIPIFHRWIKNQVLKELTIDVANYAHVPEGPGVVLIGHGSDYFMDESEGRLGLLYARKRLSPEPAARVSDAFRHAVHAAALLEKEEALAGKLRFRTDEYLFRIGDRLAAPNTEQTFAAVRAELEAIARPLFDGGPFEVGRVGEPRQLFSARLKGGGKSPLAAVLERLGGPPAPDGSKPS